MILRKTWIGTRQRDSVNGAGVVRDGGYLAVLAEFEFYLYKYYKLFNFQCAVLLNLLEPHWNVIPLECDIMDRDMMGCYVLQNIS